MEELTRPLSLEEWKVHLFQVAPAYAFPKVPGSVFASAPTMLGQSGQQNQQQQDQNQGGQGQGRQGQAQQQPQRATQYVAAGALAGQDVDFDPNPQYSYAYDVQDTLTGDNKAQQVQLVQPSSL